MTSAFPIDFSILLGLDILHDPKVQFNFSKVTSKSYYSNCAINLAFTLGQLYAKWP